MYDDAPWSIFNILFLFGFGIEGGFREHRTAFTICESDKGEYTTKALIQGWIQDFGNAWVGGGGARSRQLLQTKIRPLIYMQSRDRFCLLSY